MKVGRVRILLKTSLIVDTLMFLTILADIVWFDSRFMWPLLGIYLLLTLLTVALLFAPTPEDTYLFQVREHRDETIVYGGRAR